MENVIIADLTNPLHSRATIELLNEYAQTEAGGGRELSKTVKQNLIPELIKRSHAFVVIAFIDDEPAGLAIGFEGFSTFACKPLLNIHDFVVSAKFRGRRLSYKLLAKVEELARERGCCKITLEVLEGNVIAQKAYRSFGFEGYELDPQMGKALFWQKKLI